MIVSNTDSTMMSMLFGLAHDQLHNRDYYLSRFCETYSKPLTSYLCATRKVPEDVAIDLVHDFWLRNLLEPDADRNLIAKYLQFHKANPNSSFRRYLARSVSNFFINHYKSRGERQRRQAVSIEAFDSMADVQENHLEVFDTIWSTELLQRVLDRVREDCLRHGHELKWKIFVELVLRPCLTGDRAEPYQVLADRFDLESPKVVGNAWITVKRMIRRQFEHAVRDYVPSHSIQQGEATTVAETEELLVQLARTGGLHLKVPELRVRSGDARLSRGFDLESNPLPDLYQSDDDLAQAWAAFSKEPLQAWLAERCPAGFLVSDLIRADEVPLDVLQDIRIAAKHRGRVEVASNESNAHVPREICGLVYLLAIARARLLFKEDISGTGKRKLSSRMASYIDFQWVPPTCCRLLESCIHDFGTQA